MFSLTAKLMTALLISYAQAIIQKFIFDHKQADLLLAAILPNVNITMYFVIKPVMKLLVIKLLNCVEECSR